MELIITKKNMKIFEKKWGRKKDINIYIFWNKKTSLNICCKIRNLYMRFI